jgi:hypothetical protein
MVPEGTDESVKRDVLETNRFSLADEQSTSYKKKFLFAGRLESVAYEFYDARSLKTE